MPADGDVLLAIDFGGTKCSVAVADRSGAIQSRTTIPTLQEQGSEQVVARTIGASRELLARSRSDLAGVGVSSMGITEETRVLIAPNVSGWEELRLPAVLRDAFPEVPIRIENDVKTATFAELKWGALQGVNSGIYVNLGTGIAAGLVVGGRIALGAHGAAGEIAFNPLSPAELSGAGEGRAPLEEWAGGRVLEQRLRGRLHIDIGDLFARYCLDDDVTRELDHYFDVVAFHLANLAIALDPAVIVLGAGLMRAKDVVLPALRDRIAPLMPFPAEIVPAAFLTDAALVGAVALAMEPMPAI